MRVIPLLSICWFQNGYLCPCIGPCVFKSIDLPFLTAEIKNLDIIRKKRLDSLMAKGFFNREYPFKTKSKDPI